MIEIKYITGESTDISKAIDDYFDVVTHANFSLLALNSKSRKFIEKRTANSLLSQYAATAPFLLFCKEGVVVSAIYNESIKDLTVISDLITINLKQTLNATVTHVDDDGAYFREDS